MRFLDSLISALRGIQASNQDVASAIRASTETYKQWHEPPSTTGTPSPFQLPEAIAGYYKAEQEARRRNDIWKTIERIAALLVLGISVTAAIFTYHTLRQITRQTNLVADEQRPWIKLIDATLSDTDALSFDPPRIAISPGEALTMVAPLRADPLKQIVVHAAFRLKNIGKSVAQNATVFSEVFVNSPTDSDALSNEQRRFCESSGKGDLRPQTTRSAVFPDDEFTVKIGCSGYAYKSDTLIIDGLEYIDLVLIGCATYQESRDFQTRFAYHLAGTSSGRVKLGENLAKDNIRFIRDEHAEYAQ